MTIHDTEGTPVDEPIAIPPNVASCPICGASLMIEAIVEWEDETGLPVAIEFGCETEPDAHDPDWPDWHRWHYRMPYVDWLPLQEPILAWAREHFVCS